MGIKAEIEPLLDDITVSAAEIEDPGARRGRISGVAEDRGLQRSLRRSFRHAMDPPMSRL